MSKSYMKLRGKIIEKYGSQSCFAEKVGISDQSLTAKLNGRTQIAQDDIIKWRNLLDIDVSEIGSYFFADKL